MGAMLLWAFHPKPFFVSLSSLGVLKEYSTPLSPEAQRKRRIQEYFFTAFGG